MTQKVSVFIATFYNTFYKVEAIRKRYLVKPSPELEAEVREIFKGEESFSTELAQRAVYLRNKVIAQNPDLDDPQYYSGIEYIALAYLISNTEDVPWNLLSYSNFFALINSTSFRIYRTAVWHQELDEGLNGVSLKFPQLKKMHHLFLKCIKWEVGLLQMNEN